MHAMRSIIILQYGRSTDQVTETRTAIMAMVLAVVLHAALSAATTVVVTAMMAMLALSRALVVVATKFSSGRQDDGQARVSAHGTMTDAKYRGCVITAAAAAAAVVVTLSPTCNSGIVFLTWGVSHIFHCRGVYFPNYCPHIFKEYCYKHTVHALC